jgi:succinyl-diaminopimelate desuccinylase
MDPLELARQLVRIDTVNPPGGEAGCIEPLADLLRHAGFHCRVVELGPGRTNLVARLESQRAGPALCFTGHVDVVPLGAAPWKHDPFGADVVDGRLYGRGSTDMKSGIAAFVSAAIEAAPRIRDEGVAVALAITAGEETGCEGAARVVADAAALEVLGSVGALLVGEPTANRPLLGHKGALWLSATATGKTAHGSMPHEGDNAVYKLARAALQLEQFDFGIEPHPVMGEPTLSVGTFFAGININSVPDRATMGIDIRTITGQDHRAVLRCICHRLGADIAVQPVLDVDNVFTEAGNPWVQDVARICQRHTGENTGVATVPYFTDAAKLRGPLGSPPVVILGPGDPAMAHQTDEYCPIVSIERVHAIYADLIATWCLSKPS